MRLSPFQAILVDLSQPRVHSFHRWTNGECILRCGGQHRVDHQGRRWLPGWPIRSTAVPVGNRMIPSEVIRVGETTGTAMHLEAVVTAAAPRTGSTMKRATITRATATAGSAGRLV